MKSLPTRVASAVFALVLIGIVTYFFHAAGLLCLGLLICSLGIFEFHKIVFGSLVTLTPAFRLWFLFCALTLLFLSVLGGWEVHSVWGIFITLFISSSLWALRDKIELETLLKAISLSALGFLYAAFLPSFALSLLNVDSGFAWFILLLAVVFTGDVFAYFGGITLGRTKIMPSVSPNKTLAGSLSGLCGSIVAGVVVRHLALSFVPLISMVLLSTFAGALAQNGDLFESLLKRVGAVKDSGRIMPGHGGVLDRLDGIYFAAPLIYFAYSYFTI